jgi:type IV pilus assembly protein PilM
MALPFISSRSKRRDQIIAIDLGSRTTKAVSVERTEGGFKLTRFALQDAPIYEKNISPELLGDHLKNILQALESKTKQINLAVGVGDSVLRNTEMPLMPLPEMRTVLKFNSKVYLQQDLPDYVFDCYILPPKGGAEAFKPEPGKVIKQRVWIGGARRQILEDMQAAARVANLQPDQVNLAVLGPVNAFEMAHPDVFQKEVVALVDLGFKNSTISVLSAGELALSRVVGIGGDKLTAGLAESINVSYAEAEGIKIGMPGEVESSLQPLLSPLGRELRASIDFFEHQQDKTVSQIFVSGAAARSDFILTALQTELMVPCRSWNPSSFLQMGLPPQQVGEIEQVAPELAVAVGTAVSSF